jgi:hypothetical protein
MLTMISMNKLMSMHFAALIRGYKIVSQVDDDRDSICIRYLSKPAMPRTQLEV